MGTQPSIEYVWERLVLPMAIARWGAHPALTLDDAVTMAWNAVEPHREENRDYLHFGKVGEPGATTVAEEEGMIVVKHRWRRG